MWATSLICFLIEFSAVHTALLGGYPPAMGSRIQQHNIFYHDTNTTIKEYRSETWTTTSTTPFVDTLPRIGMMNKETSTDLILDQSILPRLSSASNGKGLSDPTPPCESSPSPKGKGMNRKPNKSPKMKNKPKKGKMSKSNKKGKGQGKSSSSPATTVTPTVTSQDTTAPSIPSGTTITPTVSPVSIAIPSLPPKTTAIPVLIPVVTKAPSFPNGLTATPSFQTPVDIAPPIRPPLLSPAPSLPPRTTTTQPAVAPTDTTAPLPPPVVSPTPSPLPDTTSTPNAPSLPPGTTLTPTVRQTNPTGTLAPITTSIPAPSTTTSVPTASPFSFVPATPFRLTYMLTESREPNEFEYAMAADVALLHIEAVLRDQFSNALGIEVNVFNGMMTAMGFNPVTIDFTVEVSFTNDASFVPTTADIDQLIEVALLPPELDGLIADYNALPTDSPFSTTQSVAYEAL